MLASSITRMPSSGPRGPSGSTTRPTIDPTTTVGSSHLRPEGDDMGIRLGAALRHARTGLRRTGVGAVPGGGRAVRHRRRRRLRHRVPRRAPRRRRRLLPVADGAGVGDARADEADDGALLRAHRRAAQPAAAGRGPRRARPRLRWSGRDDARHRLPPPRVRDVRRAEVQARADPRGDHRRARAGVERRAVRVPGHDGADPADARAEAAPADLHRRLDRGVGAPGRPLRRRLHAGHAAAVRGVRRGAPAPRQAGDGRAGPEGSAVPLRHRRPRAQLGRRRPARHVHDQLQRRVGEGAWRRARRRTRRSPTWPSSRRTRSSPSSRPPTASS